MSKQNKRRIANRQKRRPNQSTRNAIVYRSMTMAQMIPDVLRAEVGFSFLPTNAFITAATGGGVTFFGNSLLHILLSTVGITTYATGKMDDYEKYRVEGAEVTITVGSRETTKNQFLIMFPTMTSTVVSASNFDEYQNLPWTKRTVLGPVTSGQSITAMTQYVDYSKFVGPHYREQDEYAGSITVGAPGNPSSFVYWQLGYYNPDTNTVTTGGLSYQIVMKLHVTFYQPVRDSANLLKKREQRVEITEEESAVLRKYNLSTFPTLQT